MYRIDEIVRYAKDNKIALQSFFHKKDMPGNMSKHIFHALVLLSIESPIELSRFLNIPISHLEKTINKPDYKHYTVRKKRGGQRHIYAPEKQLKKIQKRLNYFLQAWYLWIKPEEVHGFVINPHYLGRYCNIAANAAIHTGKKQVLNIDLKDFFECISAKRIKSVFTSPYFNFNEHIAIALTLLTTYQAKLPTGAPTSPVLSNFVCLPLDAQLQTFCKENGLQYTRYADDLTFSADTDISYDTILDIILLIQKNGFSINVKKLRQQSSSRKQTVTGLTVNKKVNVDRKMLKKIRAMLHDLQTNGLEAATRRHFKLHTTADSDLQSCFMNRLDGYINFVGQIRGKEDAFYRKYINQYESIFAKKM